MPKRTEIHDKGDLSGPITRLKKFSVESVADLERNVEIAVGIFESEATERAPVGATGDLRGSIFGETRTMGDVVEGRVGTPVTHATPVELGTGPQGRLKRSRKAPPSNALHEWVRRKLGIQDEQEVQSVSFLIARAIGRRGTEPQNFFADAWKHTRKTIQPLFEKGQRLLAQKIWPWS